MNDTPINPIAFVRRYNAWRRNDDDSEMPHPKDIGESLDALCDLAERLEREIHAWQTELSKVMPPDFKDWWQNSKAEWPLVARLVIEGKNRRAEQMERELGSPTDSPDANTTAHARINWWKDRCDDLNEQLAAKDAHADKIYKAAVDLANMLSDKLDAERALADRLAACMAHLAAYDWFIDGTHSHSVVCSLGPNRVREALAAWKASRDPNNLEGPGPSEQERRENARAIQALSVPDRFALMFGKTETKDD